MGDEITHMDSAILDVDVRQDTGNSSLQNVLGISSEDGRILAVIDFGNVNYWFENDRHDADGIALTQGQKMRIDIKGLASFTHSFAKSMRFYYGYDAHNRGSVQFIAAVKYACGRHNVFTKQIQKIRHYIAPADIDASTRSILSDRKGVYVCIPKCNFDVEISIDTVRLLDTFDTLVLFSGDADFVALARFLKSKGKKIILIKHGNITAQLRKEADEVISAQRIKKHITEIVTVMQKPGI